VRGIRLANLPPEVSDRTIRGALSPYGEVAAIHEDSWSSAYRYPVSNGVRIAVTKLKKTSTVTYHYRGHKGTGNV
jgi:hypothetical protein